MAELRELLSAIPRPAASHHRVRRHGRLRQLGRRVLPYLLMFLATYLALVTNAGPRAARWVPWVQALLTPAGLVSLFALIFAVVFARARRLRTMMLANNEGTLLRAQGKGAEAVALYESLTRRGRGKLPQHALFVGNRGVAAMFEGELELAQRLLGEALRSGWLTRGKGSAVAGYFASCLSRAYALANDLRAARAWREVATEHLAAHRRGTLLIADAIVLLRAGHAGAAADAISSGWMGAEGELPSHERRTLRALQAFGFVQSGRDAEAAAALAGLWPPIPNQLEYLGRDWPELNGFLVTWKLARAA